MKKSAIYYVVSNQYNGVLGLKEENVLWSLKNTDANPATLFKTRREAKNAIKRTLAYAKKHYYETHFNSPWGGQVINAVKENQ